MATSSEAGHAEWRRRAWGNAALAFCASVWLGLLLGVSFIATPVKFSAATLTLPVALDVGRVTFALFSRLEWAAAALLVISLSGAGFRRLPTVLAGLLLGLVALQSFWLLPILDARIAAIVAGTPVRPTSHHMVYIAMDTAKVVALLCLAVLALGRLVRSAPAQDLTLAGPSSAHGRPGTPARRA